MEGGTITSGIRVEGQLLNETEGGTNQQNEATNEATIGGQGNGRKLLSSN